MKWLLKYLFSPSVLTLLLLPCAVSQAVSDKSQWDGWTQTKQAAFKEKFSAPSITHSYYLKSQGDTVKIEFSQRGPRFTNKVCEQCQWAVARSAPSQVQLVKLSDKTAPRDIKGKDHLLLSPSQKVFVSWTQVSPKDPIRVYIHDLGQKGLERKRQRHFFPYNKSLKVNGAFRWLKTKKDAKIQRSDGSAIEIGIIGKIDFIVMGKPASLSVYNFSEDKSFREESQSMLLFRDLSSGRQTYGAGRFLNVDFAKKMGQLKDGDPVALDFNFSYNPPCSVSTGFHCPLPQDLLQAQILAGEKYKLK